jgi:hypothetical protein
LADSEATTSELLQDIAFLLSDRYLFEPAIVQAGDPGGGVYVGTAHAPVFLSFYNSNNDSRDLSATWRTNRQLNLDSIVLHDLLPWEQKINNRSMDYDGRSGEVWQISFKQCQCINDLNGTHKLKFVGSIFVFLNNNSFLLSDIPIKTLLKLNICSVVSTM